jgi:hypothetical protein
MHTNNKKKNDLSLASLGLRICINFCWILLNTAVIIFLVVTRLIIIILRPFVWLSLILENLNLKLKLTILKENSKYQSENESDSKV